MDVRSNDKIPKDVPKGNEANRLKAQGKDKPKNPLASAAPQMAFGEMFNQHLVREPAREETHQDREGFSEDDGERDGLEEYARDSDSTNGDLGTGRSSKKQKVLGKKDVGEQHHGGGSHGGNGQRDFAGGSKGVSNSKVSGADAANSFSARLNPQQLLAQKALEQVEMLSQAQGAGKPLPPEVFKSLVSSISRFWDKDQEVLHLQLHEEALGGALGIKLFKDSDGVTQIHFDGDEEAVSRIEASQGDLLAQLRRPGRTVNLKFV